MGFSFLWYSEEAEVQRGHPTHGRTARIRDSREMFNLEVVILIYEGVFLLCFALLYKVGPHCVPLAVDQADLKLRVCASAC